MLVTAQKTQYVKAYLVLIINILISFLNELYTLQKAYMLSVIKL